MKKILKISLLLSISFTCNAQRKINSAIIEKFDRIVRLIKYDSVATLASLAQYPITRENPLPDINSTKEFIANYRIMVDSGLKEKLKQFSDSDIFEHNGNYGLVGGVFDGDIWLNENGVLLGFVPSETEDKLMQKMNDDIRGKMYSSIKKWKRNILVCTTEKYLIRVDETDEGLRYISWSNGHSISEKPDLILYGGKEEAQGEMGGWTYTFKNGKWGYVIDEVELCEDDKPQDCGTFLRIEYDGVEKYTYRCTETK
jgi:hypothetical protein